MQSKKTRSSAKNFHPRNIHNKGYNFKSLVEAEAGLKAAFIKNKKGEETIDFSKPESIKLLNRAILKLNYGLSYWDIPKGYLCPPVPGRVDYLLHAADLLTIGKPGSFPKGPGINVLDIGTGANLIFPIIGHKLFAWNFIGTDVDDLALESAAAIIEKNKFQNGIQLRKQVNKNKILSGVTQADDYFDLVFCNPPFHPSAEVALKGTARKWNNLSQSSRKTGKDKLEKTADLSDSNSKPTTKKNKLLNFGGQQNELVYPGGELGFIQKMLEESKLIGNQIFWFTTLVSKESHLGRLKRKLEKLKPAEMKVVEMSQGQKTSRFLAWTFLDAKQQKIWKNFRWKK